MLEQRSLDSGFWYDTAPGAQRHRAVTVLQAMRAYHDAEMSMRRRTRDALAIGENDMALLRYLLQAPREGRYSSAGELSRYLGLSTASITAMIDRLERSGHVRRERQTTDRRRINVVATERSESDMRDALGDMHALMLDAVIDMTPDDMRAVTDMLARMQDVMDAVSPDEPEPTRP